MAKYIFRLDDASEFQNVEMWDIVESLFDKYEILPIVGIIPFNEDSQLVNTYTRNKHFWDLTLNWQNKGWTIALHGFNHVYLTNDGGINPIHMRSEFAGLSLKHQKQKIADGVKILNSKGLIPKVFFAPSHTFDYNTLLALKEESNIRIISDGKSFFPYKEDDFVFIPQQINVPRLICFPGIYTFCLHPNTMTSEDIIRLEKFIMKFRKGIIDVNCVDCSRVDTKTLADTIFSKLYFFFKRKA